MEAEEFDDFYSASFDRVVRAVYAMIGDRDEAQDCTQEAFVRAWDHRAALSKASHPEAWVRTTAYRLAVSRWRRAVTRRRAPDRALQPSMLGREPSVNHVALVAALAQLPADQRRAVVLHHLCDLSVAEVAAEVGSPPGTVKARLSRGRASLAQILGEPVASSRAALDITADLSRDHIFGPDREGHRYE